MEHSKVKKDWTSEEHENEFHVVPNNDLKPHVEVGGLCPCLPRALLHPEGKLIYYHASYDQREHTEYDHDSYFCAVCNPNK